MDDLLTSRRLKASPLPALVPQMAHYITKRLDTPVQRVQLTYELPPRCPDHVYDVLDADLAEEGPLDLAGRAAALGRPLLVLESPTRLSTVDALTEVRVRLVHPPVPSPRPQASTVDDESVLVEEVVVVEVFAPGFPTTMGLALAPVDPVRPAEEVQHFVFDELWMPWEDWHAAALTVRAHLLRRNGTHECHATDTRDWMHSRPFSASVYDTLRSDAELSYLSEPIRRPRAVPLHALRDRWCIAQTTTVSVVNRHEEAYWFDLLVRPLRAFRSPADEWRRWYDAWSAVDAWPRPGLPLSDAESPLLPLEWAIEPADVARLRHAVNAAISPAFLDQVTRLHSRGADPEAFSGTDPPQPCGTSMAFSLDTVRGLPEVRADFIFQVRTALESDGKVPQYDANGLVQGLPLPFHLLYNLLLRREDDELMGVFYALWDPPRFASLEDSMRAVGAERLSRFYDEEFVYRIPLPSRRAAILRGEDEVGFRLLSRAKVSAFACVAARDLGLLAWDNTTVPVSNATRPSPSQPPPSSSPPSSLLHENTVQPSSSFRPCQERIGCLVVPHEAWVPAPFLSHSVASDVADGVRPAHPLGVMRDGDVASVRFATLRRESQAMTVGAAVSAARSMAPAEALAYLTAIVRVGILAPSARFSVTLEASATDPSQPSGRLVLNDASEMRLDWHHPVPLAAGSVVEIVMNGNPVALALAGRVLGFQ